MQRAKRRWLIAIGMVIGLIVLQRVISSELNATTTNQVCDHVSRIRKDIGHEICVRLARTGLLNPTLKKDGVSWLQVHGF
jgi:hypothetical protein